MKVICIWPKPEYGLYGGRTYTALSEMVCSGCGKMWYEISEAKKPILPGTIICCGVCHSDLVGLTIEREAHMFRSTRFVPLGPDEHDVVRFPTNEELRGFMKELQCQ